jgi:bilin biosynthesis protein
MENSRLPIQEPTPTGSFSISPQQTDDLLAQVAAQLDADTFDRHDKVILQQLINSLGDSRGMVRLRCAETLSDIGEAATPFLVKALRHHPNVVVRRAAAKTLTLLADATAIPALLDALFQDEDTVVKGSSVGALARIGEASVPALLDILAQDHPESTKGHAAWALAFIGAQAKEHLYREITSHSPEVRAAVIGAIAKVAQEEPSEEVAFTCLIQALNDDTEIVRSEAAVALGNLAYPPALVPLMTLLQNSDLESRRAAALALMKIGNPDAISALEGAAAQPENASIHAILTLALSQLKRAIANESDT